MKPLNKKRLLLSMFLVFLTGCSLPAGLPGNTQPSGLQIITPQNGTVYTVQDWIIVKSTFGVETGATNVVLLVNGEVVREDALDGSIPSGIIQQPWRASAPGTYQLQTKLLTADGGSHDSNVVQVQVGESAASQTPPTVETTLAPDYTPTPEATPTLGAPQATAIKDSNCRFGPGQAYEITGYLPNTQTAPIVGRRSDSSWWVIQTETGVKCWIWDELVEVSGDISNVPIVEAPPTPTPSPVPLSAPQPSAPSGTLNCTSSVQLTWQPVSHPNGVAYYEWEIDGPGGKQTGTTASTSQEIIVACGNSTYTWRVRTIDKLGNTSGFSDTLTFTVK